MEAFEGLDLPRDLGPFYIFEDVEHHGEDRFVVRDRRNGQRWRHSSAAQAQYFGLRLFYSIVDRHEPERWGCSVRQKVDHFNHFWKEKGQSV